MIDKVIVEQARNSDLIAFLERHSGFHFQYVGGTYRAKEHSSLAVKSDRRSWYWHSKGIGGYGVIDFLMKIDGYDFKRALVAVSDVPTPLSTQATMARATLFEGIPSTTPKPFILPEKAKTNHRAYAYLTKSRGIASTIINELFQKKYIYEDTRGNAVFVGFDEQSNPRYATLRGTHTDKPFRMDCIGSDKRYSFCIKGVSDRLYLFESAVDGLSHLSLEMLTQGDTGALYADNRLSLGGTSSVALDSYIERNPHIKELVFCLDNDEIGRKRAISMARTYADKGYYTRLELPSLKDYNEDLLQFREEQRTQKRLEVIYER